MECPTVVKETLRVDASVMIIPKVEVGEVDSCCMGKPHIETCHHNGNSNTYMVKQMICVRFPLTISTEVKAKPHGISCIKPCARTNKEPYPCKHNRRCGNERRVSFVLLSLLTILCGGKIF